MSFNITTQSQLRALFWATFPSKHYRKDKRQNEYNTVIREKWRNFVDAKQKDEQISLNLAERAIL